LRLGWVLWERVIQPIRAAAGVVEKIKLIKASRSIFCFRRAVGQGWNNCRPHTLLGQGTFEPFHQHLNQTNQHHHRRWLYSCANRHFSAR
jgi:hypothetical protein